MRRATKSEALVALGMCLVGTCVATLLAWHYPDSNGYIYVSGLTIALLIVAGFFMTRTKAT